VFDRVKKTALWIFCSFLGTGNFLLVKAQTPPDSLRQNIEKKTGIEKARAYNAMAEFYKLNKPDTAVVLSQKALEINAEYGDQMVEADGLGKIAEAYSYLAAYDSSVVYYMRAIKISEKLGNKRKMSSFYNGIGIVFYQLGDFKKSISYMKQAARLQLDLGEMVYYATITCNVAGVMNMNGQHQEAMVLLHNAEKRLKTSGNKGVLANLYNTIGSVYQHGFKNIDSAEYYYNKNISLINKPGLEAFSLAAYRNVGEIYLQKKKYELAETNFKTALTLSLELKRRTERAIIYGSLSDLYAATNRYQEAYEYKKQQSALHDSVFNEEKQAMAQRLETQYQTEKKDIRIREQDLTIQKEQNQRNKIIFISVVAILLLMAIAFYFWTKKRSKEELEKAKSRLFQNIVHEIRTPLTLITGPLALLKKEHETEKNKQQFVSIEQNAEKLVNLVNELLLTSKLEKGELEMHYAVGDVELFTRQTVEHLQNMAQEHNVRLQFMAPGTKTVRAFAATAYEKIVINLVSNAIKYNRPGGEVKVTLQLDEATIELKVQDNGTGMDRKTKEKMFDRFYRSDQQKNKPGFGIGLSVVAELVQQLKGTIDVQSEPGLGTSIQVNLPQVNINKGEAINETSEEWVLIVEDDAEIYAFIQQVLNGVGIVTQRAMNGALGFEQALQYLPDLVITDVMMPVEDGISMTTRLKNHELTSHIPVLMLSARAAVSSRLEGMQSGADMYLSKPFHPDELLLLVQNIRKTIRQNQTRFAGALKAAEKTYLERLSAGDEYLKKIVQVMETHLDDSSFSVNELADVMCISRSQLHRKITALTGFSTTHFIRIIRLEKAKDLLQRHAGNVTEVAYQCGFSSQSYFTKSFTEHFGMSPSECLK